MTINDPPAKASEGNAREAQMTIIDGLRPNDLLMN